MAARRRHKSELRESRSDAVKRTTKNLERTAPRDLRWFREKENPHETVFSLYEKISRLTAGRRAQDLYYACLYEDTEFAALFQGMQAQGEFTPQTMVSNVVKRQIDTYVERQEKNRPVPMAMANDARYSQQQRAIELSKLFSGVLDEIKYFDTLKMRRRDRAIWGNGIAQNYRVGRKLIHERVFPCELMVNPFEARYGKPRTLIRKRWIDRLVLAERFPKHEAEIMNDDYGAADTDEPYAFGRDETSDQVFLVEIWHLPNGEPTETDAKDGAHAYCISSATLQNRVYKRDYFPFSNSAFSPGLAGWWGEGMASQLRGLQYEVNSVGLRLQEQGWMTGTYVWTPTDTGLEIDHLDNGTLTHIQSEVQPTFFQPSPWHPAFFEYYMFLRGRAAAEETRLSEQATRGEVPAGVESGKAIRAWNQLDDQAFLSHGHEDERDSIDTAWQHFDLCEEIHDEEKAQAKSGKGDKSEPFTIHSEQRSYGKTLIEKLKYSEVRMDREEFTLRVFPTSLLAGTPAEQYQSAKEIAADGLISRDAVLQLLQIPDVQRVLRLETAPRRTVEKILEKILRAKDPQKAYVYPEPAMNLELCRALALQTYLDAFTDEAPEANLRMVLQFALDAEEQLEAAEADALAAEQEAAAAAMPPDQGMPLDPAAMGQDPSLYAEPEAPIMPEGAAAPEAVPMLPAM
jgi:hypothetical protein